VRATEQIELGRLQRDYTARAALSVELELEGRPLMMVATHLAHVTHGSLRQLATLRSHLPDSYATPAVLAGDMNLWGPPLERLLPGWRRAVLAKTWPSWHPHSQLDHILVTESVAALGGGAVDVGRSDHLPVVARLAMA
jgi:endonuclease/exonuclease/phosphatase family metal-dependent hydrolase